MAYQSKLIPRPRPAMQISVMGAGGGTELKLNIFIVEAMPNAIQHLLHQAVNDLAKQYIDTVQPSWQVVSAEVNENLGVIIAARRDLRINNGGYRLEPDLPALPPIPVVLADSAGNPHIIRLSIDMEYSMAHKTFSQYDWYW